MQGYDFDLVDKVRGGINPLTVLGGADLSIILDVYLLGGIIGASAGSFFVFKGNIAVLISYPNREEKNALY